jgi:hypothetical protein
MTSLIAASAVCPDGTLSGYTSGVVSSVRVSPGLYDVVLAAPVVPAQVSTMVTPIPLVPCTGTGAIQPDNITVRVQMLNMGVPTDCGFSVAVSTL